MSEEDGSHARRPKAGSQMSEMWLQNLQKQQAEASQKAIRKPIIVREVVVAVMGATGAGKSAFIKRVTSDDTIVVGSGLQSVTQKVQPFKYQRDGKHFSIIDTPGFNDTNRSDKEILEELANWLLESYRDNVKVSGIVYLHSISSPKMAGSALRNLRMFRKLCGDDFMGNVVLGTTFWDLVGEEAGAAREKELLETEGFFKEMQERGCHVVRISDDSEACVKLLSRFATKQPSVMCIQKELFEGKTLEETAAASAISEELAELQRQNNEKLADTRQVLLRKTTKHELEKAYGLQLERRAHDESMGDFATQQGKIRSQIEEEEAQGDERIAKLSQAMSRQSQGYQLQLDQLNDQLRLLKETARYK